MRSAFSINHLFLGASRENLKIWNQYRVRESIPGGFGDFFWLLHSLQEGVQQPGVQQPKNRPKKKPQRGVLVHTNSLASKLYHSILGCDQQNLENFLPDFKWSGHRLAHVFADGLTTASHKRQRTLLEAPTGTILFYHKDIKQQIVHTLLLEKYGVSKKWVIIMDRR